MAEKWFHGETSCDLPRDQPNSSDSFSVHFPQGLRVLVFDEDPQYLLTLEKHLQEFKYEVTKCDEEERAMHLLHNNQTSFDVAIIEVQNSTGNRFRLISEIGSKMDVPIIIMSQDDSVESVVTWMKNGACDYLIKPIRREDLRLIFKHVAKKVQGNVAAGEAEDRSLTNPNKRSRDHLVEAQINNEEDHEHASTSRRRRVVWDAELHQKFIEAVEHLGVDNAVPKKILELMNVDYISRENVASHLQKFRLNMKRVKNETDEKNQSLMTMQKGSMYSVEEATQFCNVQFPTHHVSNILQPSWVQQQQQQHTTNSNITTQHVSSHQHHDGVSIVFPSRNQVMTQQTHHHQTAGFACIENTEASYGYKNFEMHNEEESEVANLTSSFAQKSEEIGLFPLPDPMMGNMMMIAHDHPHFPASLGTTSHVHKTETIPSLHPSSYAHGSFQSEQGMSSTMNRSGDIKYNNGYFFDNKRLT